MKYHERTRETGYTHSPHVHEFWCSISNLPFIGIGLLRLYEGDLVVPYILYIIMGCFSFIHHATKSDRTIILDWIGIIALQYEVFRLAFYESIQLVTVFQTLLSFLVLLDDHFFQHVIPVPWGHTFWHILASFTIDNLLQDMKHHST